MKKFLSVLLSITLILGSLTVYGASASDGDKDGDICENPWGELFTSTAPTTAEPIVTTTEPIVTTTQTPVVTPSAPSGLTYSGNDTLPYYWAWSPITGAEAYNVYINGSFVKSVTVASYNGEEYFATATPGTYTIEVTVVISGVESESTKTEYIVEEEAPSSSNESSTNETTTPVEPSTDETTTPVEPSTDETTIDPRLMNKPGKVKVKKAIKKVSTKKVSVKIRKVKGATGYEVAVYKTRKNAKQNVKAIKTKYVTKVKFAVKAKELKKAKKLFIRVRAYVDVKGTKVTGKWSKVKKVKNKKK